jgi:hypothetical protein
MRYQKDKNRPVNYLFIVYYIPLINAFFLIILNTIILDFFMVKINTKLYHLVNYICTFISNCLYSYFI